MKKSLLVFNTQTYVKKNEHKYKKTFSNNLNQNHNGPDFPPPNQIIINLARKLHSDQVKSSCAKITTDTQEIKT